MRYSLPHLCSTLTSSAHSQIVQDRLTGALLEEKMAVYVRLGMRLAYRGIGPGGGMEGARSEFPSASLRVGTISDMY